MQWSQFIAEHPHLEENHGWEKTFVLEVLRRVATLQPENVQCQVPFEDQNLKRRYADFVIVDGDSVFVIEVDGWDKKGRGSGPTRDEMLDFTVRQNAIAARGWKVLRFQNSQVERNPIACASQIQTALMVARQARQTPGSVQVSAPGVGNAPPRASNRWMMGGLVAAVAVSLTLVGADFLARGTARWQALGFFPAPTATTVTADLPRAGTGAPVDSAAGPRTGQSQPPVRSEPAGGTAKPPEPSPTQAPEPPPPDPEVARAPRPPSLAPWEAGQHVGELANVCGRVERGDAAYNRSTRTFSRTSLYLAGGFRVNLPHDVRQVLRRERHGDPEDVLVGSAVCARGQIQQRQGFLQIWVNEADSLSFN